MRNQECGVAQEIFFDLSRGDLLKTHMIIYGVFRDIFRRYMLLGPYWKLLTYIITMIFMKIAVTWFKRKKMSAGRCILIIVLFSYLLTVYISTVLARKRMLDEAELLPVLWSWRQVLSGNRYVLYMVKENIIMLMPMGVLLPFIINKRDAMIQTILFGFAFSLIIEVSQKVLNVGFFEVDDLLNNMIGVIIGAVIYSGFIFLLEPRNLNEK